MRLRFLWLLPTLAACSLLSLLAGACGARSELRPGQDGAVQSGDGDSEDEPAPPSPPLQDDPDTRPPRDGPPRIFDPLHCSDFFFDYAVEPATVLLVVDRSGSMELDFGGQRRWDVVRDALFDEEGGLVTNLGDTARFGLAFYSSLDGFAGGTCPMMDYAEPAVAAAGELRGIFDGTEPLTNGDTPTGEALEAALAFLEADGAAGPRYLILITDGEPDSCAVPDPQEGQPQALSAAERVFEAGVEMFVVGVSEDVAAEHLQHMANVGQGVRADAVFGEDDEAVQPIAASDDPKILAEQIRGALGDVRSCSIPLGEDVDFGGSFELILDGAPLPANAFIVEDQTLLLGDEACDRVLSDARTLDISVPCIERAR